MNTQESIVWEQRWHPLRAEWVLFTDHRAGRPWVGETKPPDPEVKPSFDPTCYLCPGNERLSGRNPEYAGVYVFENDLPTFSLDAPVPTSLDELYLARPAHGTAEVICYHPNHAKTFADLTVAEATRVVEVWRNRYMVLAANDRIDHVLIFENKGSIVGTSNPHPHCQLYAGNLIYGITARERTVADEHYEKTGRFLSQDIVAREQSSSRVIFENESFVACVPWFARYAYEVLILPRRQIASLANLSSNEQQDLAESMVAVSIRYDNLWQIPFPYVMAIHQAPTDQAHSAAYPFHIEYHPPLRKPDTMKYLAGPEIGGGSMTNETNPDRTAAELQAVPGSLIRDQV